MQHGIPAMARSDGNTAFKFETYTATTRTRQPRRKLANQNVHCEHLTVRFLVTASSKGQFDLSVIDSSALYRFSHNYKSCMKIYLENSWLSFVVKYM